jgi:catechol 2,3-dioxygenase-like lactoylglutathione lyase family enzyme
MTEPSADAAAAVKPQPLIAVADVERASAWYQRLLGAASGHGGAEYERIVVGGALVLQLHRLGESHHHEPIGDERRPLGNGVALWFALADFDGAVTRARAAGVEVVTDVHVNPNAGQREVWLRDLDGYLVVLAEAALPARDG